MREIKEQMCFIASDFEAALKEAKGSHDKDYVLPDGRKITLGEERFRCGEILFQPRDPEMKGIHKYLFESIMRCDNVVRKDLFASIVLAGGSTMFDGIAKRLLTEV